MTIHREASSLTTTGNDGAHTDSYGGKGGGSATYQACRVSDPLVCSNTVTASSDIRFQRAAGLSCWLLRASSRPSPGMGHEHHRVSLETSTSAHHPAAGQGHDHDGLLNASVAGLAVAVALGCFIGDPDSVVVGELPAEPARDAEQRQCDRGDDDLGGGCCVAVGDVSAP